MYLLVISALFLEIVEWSQDKDRHMQYKEMKIHFVFVSILQLARSTACSVVLIL